MKAVATSNQRLASITGQAALIDEIKKTGPQEEDPFKAMGSKKIIDREDAYH